MNRTQFKDFAVWSKAYLEEEIRFSSTHIRITEDGIRQINQTRYVYQDEGLSEEYDRVIFNDMKLWGIGSKTDTNKEIKKDLLEKI
ncbi:MAG: hypothetical protein FD133_374 [Erysipelotrichaceae bacterium]|nr:MAG: hypothetical protein FD133_374 [Erysipelotrichaceae bacterium]